MGDLGDFATQLGFKKRKPKQRKKGRKVAKKKRR